MTDWAKLAEPFDASEIKERPGRGGMTFSYVDARAVMQRLDDVLTPEGWDFQSELIGDEVVKGRLVIGANIREDYGYPNSDNDDEPIKSASSDALKRCAVMFGIGRHLYSDNRHTKRADDSSRHSASQSTARTGPPPVRAAARPEPEFPDDWGDEPTPIRKADNSDNTNCPIHNVPWNGEWGDLWHKDEDGRYCRHPDNTRQGAPRKAGARR